MILIVIAVYVGILAFGTWIIQMNVNDIASYYMAGQAAPGWPFLWILLMLIMFIAPSRIK